MKKLSVKKTATKKKSANKKAEAPTVQQLSVNEVVAQVNQINESLDKENPINAPDERLELIVKSAKEFEDYKVGDQEPQQFESGISLITESQNVSPVIKAINDAHAQLKSFERTYAKIKASQIAEERKARLVIENFDGNQDELEEAIYNQLHSKHKMIMIDKIYDNLISQFDNSTFEQENETLFSLKELLEVHFDKICVSPETVKSAAESLKKSKEMHLKRCRLYNKDNLKIND